MEIKKSKLLIKTIDFNRKKVDFYFVDENGEKGK